jgi:hypothetical protein
MTKYFLIIYLFSPFCYGYCERTNVSIFFANGMFNAKQDALDSYAQLIERLPTPGFSDLQGVTLYFPGLAYNTDEPLLLQLYEVLGQKLGDLKLNFWIYLSELTSAPKEFVDLMRSIQVDLDSFGNTDLILQIKNYEKILAEPNHQIVTIAHSQGNFFTNLAFSKLGISDEIKQRLDMVSIASPSGYVFDWGAYTTLASDCIINFIPGAMAANIINEKHSYCDHSLEAYLTGKESEQKIIEDINFAIYGPSIHEGLTLPLELKRISRWYNHFTKKEKSSLLQTHQCYGARVFRSLFNLYWKNEECQKRGYEGLENTFADCLDIKNHKVKQSVPNHCPVSFGAEKVVLNLSIAESFSEHYLFRGKHAECNWERRPFTNSVVSESLNKEALKFIKSPWEEIKPY